jgi:hypothetical protein
MCKIPTETGSNYVRDTFLSCQCAGEVPSGSEPLDIGRHGWACASMCEIYTCGSNIVKLYYLIQCILF